MKIKLMSIVMTIFACLLFGQEVKNGSIIAYGQEKKIDLIEKDGKVYISWNDLNSALPGWFTVNKNGQIEISSGLMALLINGVKGNGNINQYNSGDVIESTIDGDFEGWEGETIFKLQNGQIWQQAEYDYTYSYSYCPNVTIIKTSKGWIMQVEGMTETVKVNRLK